MFSSRPRDKGARLALSVASVARWFEGPLVGPRMEPEASPGNHVF
jgi:hypothetical protein